MTARFANLHGNAKRETPREPVRYAFGLKKPLQADKQPPPAAAISSLKAADRLRFALPSACNRFDRWPIHTAANTFLKDSLPKPR
jgi:hypothetical protein